MQGSEGTQQDQLWGQPACSVGCAGTSKAPCDIYCGCCVISAYSKLTMFPCTVRVSICTLRLLQVHTMSTTIQSLLCSGC
jgi:hypothetical protein